jgi:hypothetical protein
LKTRSDIDPYNEEKWDDKTLDEIPLYLSEDQPKVYANGSPLQRPWTGKNLVLFNNKDKYYVLGEIRYTPRDFFMFYTHSDSIERKRLNEFRGEILRELNNREKIHVLDILSKERLFTRNLFDNENGRTYIDIINNLINEDFLVNIDGAKPVHKIARFSEYRKGSSEYGQLFQDLMMILRAKKEEDKGNDEIILNREEFKDFDKLLNLTNDIKKMRKLGMTFDVEILDNDNIRFSNLGNKQSRPWENLDSDPYGEEIWNEFANKNVIYTGNRFPDRHNQPVDVIEVIEGEYPQLFNHVRNELVTVGPKGEDIYSIRFKDGKDHKCLKKFLKII